MSNYIQIEFQNISRNNQIYLLPSLTEIGFEGFEEEESKLKSLYHCKQL